MANNLFVEREFGARTGPQDEPDNHGNPSRTFFL
jgi:hypothetical protein